MSLFFLAARIFELRFADSPPALFFFFKVEISSRSLIPLFSSLSLQHPQLPQPFDYMPDPCKWFITQSQLHITSYEAKNFFFIPTPVSLHINTHTPNEVGAGHCGLILALKWNRCVRADFHLTTANKRRWGMNLQTFNYNPHKRGKSQQEHQFSSVHPISYTDS